MDISLSDPLTWVVVVVAPVIIVALRWGMRERAARLADELEDFRIVVDHVDGVRELAAAATGRVQVLVDVDVGTGRTGVHDLAQAAEVGRAILAEPALRLIGVQGYGGHWQHM